MNAKEELLKHIGDREVKYVRVIRDNCRKTMVVLEGTLDEVLPKLDFEYDNGYGLQRLEGTIWYCDGTWSERGEYDGAEWWEHRECSPLPNASAEVPR